MKIKIGITGGIGSGKSSVARIIQDSGYLVLDADNIAREILSNFEAAAKRRRNIPRYAIGNCFGE